MYSNILLIYCNYAFVTGLSHLGKQVGSNRGIGLVGNIAAD
jgi:hypothetical protein